MSQKLMTIHRRWTRILVTQMRRTCRRRLCSRPPSQAQTGGSPQQRQPVRVRACGRALPSQACLCVCTAGLQYGGQQGLQYGGQQVAGCTGLHICSLKQQTVCLCGCMLLSGAAGGAGEQPKADSKAQAKAKKAEEKQAAADAEQARRQVGGGGCMGNPARFQEFMRQVGVAP